MFACTISQKEAMQGSLELVGADRGPYGSSCSCAYSWLPLQPRSSSTALSLSYIIKGYIVWWMAARTMPLLNMETLVA